jgi:hypothetical protein
MAHTSTHFVNPRGKGRPVLHASPTRVEPEISYTVYPSCLHNKHKAYITIPYWLILLADSEERRDADTRAAPLLGGYCSPVVGE